MKRYLMLLLAVILLVPAGTTFAGPWGRGMVDEPRLWILSLRNVPI